MKTDRLYEILRATTTQLRKGEVVREEKHENFDVVHIELMPHVSEVTDPDIEIVDVHFINIGVKKSEAPKYRDELIAILKTYPNLERFRQGLSYIEVAVEVGDQGATFQLFALGKVLGLWDVMTPEKMGMTGKDADELAGRGFIMAVGVKEI